MTDKYKNILLGYVTNTVTQTTPHPVEIIKEVVEGEAWAQDGVILPTNVSVKYEGMIGANEQTSGLTILYGGYAPTGQLNEARGIITLVDSNFKPVKSFFTYDSGTYLRYIHCMGQAEDGTFYMIDDEKEPYAGNADWKTTIKRFVMVNNFSIINPLTNDYSLTLRKSYNFPTAYRNFYCKDIYKDANSSSYVMFGASLSTTQDFNMTSVISLKVNVGQSNEWSINTTTDNYLYGGSFAIFDSSNQSHWKVLFTNPNAVNTNIYMWEKGFQDANPTFSIAVDLEIDAMIDTKYHSNQCCFLSENEVYFVSDNQRKNASTNITRYLGLYYYNFLTDTLNVIKEENYGVKGMEYNGEAIYISENSGQIYAEYNTNINTVNSKVYADYYVQRVENFVWIPKLIAEQKLYSASYRGFYVDNSFNLLKMYLYNNRAPLNWYQAVVKENYNPVNYNGTQYGDYSSLVPQQAEVYSNGSLVFARNLYDYSTSDNQTVSTIVVPNSYLNDINIDNKILYSVTNNQLVEDSNVITKNIYETLYMNFINTLGVINEDTNVKFPTAAAYVASNIGVGTQENCENSFAGKVKVVKYNSQTQEETTNIFDITWNRAGLVDDYCETQFALYSGQYDEYRSISLLSYDETTTYADLDVSQMTSGTANLVTQKIRIE